VLSNPAALRRTVAHGLARYDTSFASNLVSVLKSGTADIASRSESLFTGPLTKRHEHSSPSVIITIFDDFDECGSDSSQAGLLNALPGAVTDRSRLPGAFKCLVTGGGERVPGLLRFSCRQTELPTEAEVNIDAKQDTHIFLKQCFVDIGATLSTLDALASLVIRAAGLFIWAEAVLRFVDQGISNKRRERFLNGGLGELGAEDNVNKPYSQILELLRREVNDRALDVLDRVITATILAKIPLQFILQPKLSFDLTFDKPSCLISIGRDTGTRNGHPSLADFFSNSHRCTEKFYIGKKSHKMSTCVHVMKAGICDILKRIARKFQHPLLYSVHYWAVHIQNATTDRESATRISDLIRISDFTRVMQVAALDGRRIAWSSDKRYICIWDTQTGEMIPGTDCVRSIAFSPYDKPVDSSSDKMIGVWHDETGEMISGPCHDHTDCVRSVVFSLDSKRIVSGSWDKTIRLWEAETGAMVSGKWTFSGSDDQSVRIWDGETGEEVFDSFEITFEGYANSVWSVAFSPYCRRIAFAFDDKCIRDNTTSEVRLLHERTGNIILDLDAIPRHASESGLSAATSPHHSDTTNQRRCGDNTFEKLWDIYPRYRFTQSHLRFLGTFADVRGQPGWIFPTEAKILVNIMQTEDMDTWSGQVEGSEERGMFLSNSVEPV